MATTLIVLAATMGNKYGGLKQLEGIGPNGETILDYSIYDAVSVGFKKVIFVISRFFEEDFKKMVSDKYENLVEVEYVYQEVDLVPEDQRNPKRNLLWGSAHAVLLAENAITEPFGVINAVNFYQRESFALLYEHLQKKDYPYFLISYRLKNVMAESIGVTRGICELTSDNDLISVTDRHGIERVGGNLVYPDEFNQLVTLDEEAFVSMNMWGFPPEIFKSLHEAFGKFIIEKGKELETHLSIPEFINNRIKEGLTVKAIETPGKWMGLVSPDDRSQVILRINEMIRKGIYPTKLF